MAHVTTRSFAPPRCGRCLPLRFEPEMAVNYPQPRDRPVVHIHAVPEPGAVQSGGQRQIDI